MPDDDAIALDDTPAAMAATGSRQTRASPRAPDAAGLSVTVVAVHVPPGAEDRRNPVVLVDAEIGPVTVRLGVVSMKRGRWHVRPPEAADRSDGVTLPPVLAQLVHDAVLAAVEADPEARGVLLSRDRPRGRFPDEGGE